MNPLAQDRSRVLATTEYLTALNDIFERTILGSKVRIFQHDGTAMQHLGGGYAYFKEWAEELGIFDDRVDSKQFLSWQVSFRCTMHAS